MGEHPSRDELSAFLRGDLSAEERRSAKGLEREHRREKARIQEIAARLPASSSAVPRGLPRKGKADVEKLEALLAKSWSLRYEDPGEMVRYAMMAVQCAKSLDARVLGRERVLDLLGRAQAELGNAYRVLDQLDAAEAKLEEAGRTLELGTGDESLKMHLLDLEASLAAARRRFDIAAIYLVTLSEYHEARGDRHLAGRAIIQRGLYVGYSGKPEQALRLLEEGLSRVDQVQEPELVQTAIHNQLHFIIDCGRFDEARKFRFLNAEVLNRDNGRINRVRLRGLEGRIESGLGRPDRAEAIFRETKQEFEALERPYVASIVGLDLAAALLAQDRSDEAAEVVLAAHKVFKALRIKREALAAVLVLFHVIRMGRATARMAEEVAAFLRRLERDPNARFDPWPL